MKSTIKFQSASFNVNVFGAMTESEFVKSFAHAKEMFGNSGDKKDALLKEAYKLIKAEYDKANKVDKTETKDKK